MSRIPVGELKDYSQFRQTLLAKPPAIVHGTALLSVVLVVLGVSWAGLTEAELVVRAPGRMRSASREFEIFVPETSQSLGYNTAGEVEQAFYRQGNKVKRGQVLLQISTRRLDQQLSRLNLALQTSEADIERLEQQIQLQHEAYTTEREKVQAELAQAEEKLRRAEKLHVIQIQRAEAELQYAELNRNRLEKLREGRAVSDAELEEARLKVRQAQAQLEIAKQPPDERDVEVRRRTVDLLEKQFALQKKELEAHLSQRKFELRRDRKDQAALEQERKRATLRSPADGVVTSPEVKAGDVLIPGKPVVVVAEQDDLHFEALVSSKDANRLERGMPVRIKLDAFDYQWYGTVSGKIEFISPDSQIAENGEHQGARYVVRVGIEHYRLQRGALEAEVQLGATGTAEIITDRKSILTILRKNIRQAISLG